MTSAIGPPLPPAETRALVAAARAQLGVRFRHQGRSMRGVDCLGIVAMSYTAIGRAVADKAAYGREPLRQGLRAGLIENLGQPASLDSMQAGDVAFMRFAGEPTHIGILGDYPYGGLSLIHAYAGARRVVEHRLDDAWRARIVEVFRGAANR